MTAHFDANFRNGTPGNRKTRGAGFVVSHPFHDGTVKWMGHGALLEPPNNSRMRHPGGSIFQSNRRPMGLLMDEIQFCERVDFFTLEKSRLAGGRFGAKIGLQVYGFEQNNSKNAHFARI